MSVKMYFLWFDYDLNFWLLVRKIVSFRDYFALIKAKIKKFLRNIQLLGINCVYNRSSRDISHLLTIPSNNIYFSHPSSRFDLQLNISNLFDKRLFKQKLSFVIILKVTTGIIRKKGIDIIEEV
jgi:hypothetical protein